MQLNFKLYLVEAKRSVNCEQAELKFKTKNISKKNFIIPVQSYILVLMCSPVKRFTHLAHLQ